MFGDGCSSSDYIETVNRYNYLTVFKSHAERAGASPGPFSSIFFMGYPLYGLIFLTAFYAWIITLISRFIVYSKEISIGYYLLVPLFIMPFFESPLDAFYIIDPAMFAVLFFSIFILTVNFDEIF